MRLMASENSNSLSGSEGVSTGGLIVSGAAEVLTVALGGALYQILD
jgi:hypothetical protein